MEVAQDPVSGHAWQFVRVGGVDQVVFRNGQDIARLRELDPKLWVALACPTQGLEFDSRTLSLIDSNGDGRIRPPELIAACEWAAQELATPDLLLEGGDSLAVAQLAPQGELAAEARQLLEILGKKPHEAITLTEVTARQEALATLRFNGDGVVTPVAADDPLTRSLIETIIAVQGGVADRNGELGVDRARVTAFYAQVHSLVDWQVSAQNNAAAFPLGEATVAAAQALQAVHDKVEDYFARCRVARFDTQAAQALNPQLSDYEALTGAALDEQRVRALPLAAVTATATLSLTDGLNPAWQSAVQHLRDVAVRPLLGETCERLTQAQWHQLKASLAPACDWLASKPANTLPDADPATLAQWMAGRDRLLSLIDQDEGAEAHHVRLGQLERLLRYKRDLLNLLRNFVSFQSFYQREGAIFQAGTLYLDGRSCDLTVRVEDATQHALLAGLAKTCLAYCECTREGQKLHIVAAFMAGDVDFLFVGRNGLFLDRQGRDWDASIVKLIENPTSVGQAFFSPYKKFLRMVEEQVAKRAAASEAASNDSLSAVAQSLSSAGQPGAADATSKPGAVSKPGSRFDVGTVAALGVALGSISAVLVAIFGKFIDLGPWIPVAVMGLVVAISGPSMLVAWLKLRQRSLGPILDASGWAINGRMKVNVRLGASLSQVARVPVGARRYVPDPYADPVSRMRVLGALLVVLTVAVLLWRMGGLEWASRQLPDGWQPLPATSEQQPAEASGAAPLD